MERWILYAILSMLFAGATAVITKVSLEGINSDLAVAIRSIMVCGLVLIFSWWAVPGDSWEAVERKHYWWLFAAAVASTLSLVFYFKAIQGGDVSTVSLIDKGSVLVAIVLAVTFLGEELKWQTVVGGVLMLTGLVIVSRK